MYQCLMSQWQSIQYCAIFEIQLVVALLGIGKTFCCFLTEGNPGGHAAVRWRVIHVQAGPAYIPTIGPTIQPTNRPPFPHAPNMPKPQPPIHSFPLTRNSVSHKQVSPSYSSLPMVAKFQLVHRICSYCERLSRKQFSSHGA